MNDERHCTLKWHYNFGLLILVQDGGDSFAAKNDEVKNFSNIHNS